MALGRERPADLPMAPAERALLSFRGGAQKGPMPCAAKG